MSASEFAFLALGLLLGVAAGAALLEVARSRPPAPHEVRLTVAPDAIPRRGAATLSTAAFASDPGQVARGGPADRRAADRDAPPNDPAPRRPLAPIDAGPAAARADASTNAPAAVGASTAVGVPVHREPDPAMAAMRRIAASSAERSIRPGTVTSVIERADAPPSAALASADPGPGPGGDTPRSAPAEAADPAEAGPCAEERRIADERCALAVRARGQAEAAHDTLRSTQRAYDDHLTRADRAAADADPRAIRAAKEAAQHTFRVARAAATNRDAVEAAARDWLNEINQINITARDAANVLERERAGANALIPVIERLTVDADAARIAAESAEVTCIAAREAVADCQEAASAPPVAIATETAAGAGRSGSPAAGWTSDDEAAITLATGEGEAAILRLLRGDRATMLTLIAALGGNDPAERRRWQLALSGLVEAIVARAIETATLDFPPDHPFWGPFTRSQNRDIVAALSSLGYRYDGLGDWIDGRAPTQRDLSLAVGYAGLDPMRIRHWPNEAEMVELLRDVAVAADEYLAGAAGGLSLGELVSVLGLRADVLTDLWNDWGRVRPLLLAAT